jgi:hypothetical protein
VKGKHSVKLEDGSRTSQGHVVQPNIMNPWSDLLERKNPTKTDLWHTCLLVLKTYSSIKNDNFMSLTHLQVLLSVYPSHLGFPNFFVGVCVAYLFSFLCWICVVFCTRCCQCLCVLYPLLSVSLCFVPVVVSVSVFCTRCCQCLCVLYPLLSVSLCFVPVVVSVSGCQYLIGPLGYLYSVYLIIKVTY